MMAMKTSFCFIVLVFSGTAVAAMGLSGQSDVSKEVRIIFTYEHCDLRM